MKFKKIGVLLFSGFFSAALAVGSEFDLEMQESMAGFEKHGYEEFATYKRDIESEFKVYKTIIDEEFSRYREKILKSWSTAEVPGKTKWVEYSDNYKTKKSVDYENGVIEISVILPKNTRGVSGQFKDSLASLIRQDSKSAYTNDAFSQGVEERLVTAGVDIKKAESIDSVPLISDIVTGSAHPDPEQTEKAAEDLVKKGEITVSESKIPGNEEVKIKITLPTEHMQRKAMAYVDYVDQYSEERKIDPALIFAVIQTESSFNPMARSYIPAYGLMQIVPGSAGVDASQLVFGKKKIFGPSYLFNAKNNIEIGTAYLYVLTKRYMRRIKNRQSRIYCAIAAYNTGSVNVAKAFGYNGIQSAAPHINKMTPDEVYKTLIEKLPHSETIKYLKKVTKRMNHYERI